MRWRPHPVKLLQLVHENESTVHTAERALVTQCTNATERCTTIAKRNGGWKPQFHGAISCVEIAAVVVIVEFSGGLSPCEDHSLTESRNEQSTGLLPTDWLSTYTV